MGDIPSLVRLQAQPIWELSDNPLMGDTGSEWLMVDYLFLHRRLAKRACPVARFHEDRERRHARRLPPATIPPSVDSTNTGPAAQASAEHSAAIVAAVITAAVIATAAVICRTRRP